MKCNLQFVFDLKNDMENSNLKIRKVAESCNPFVFSRTAHARGCKIRTQKYLSGIEMALLLKSVQMLTFDTVDSCSKEMT